eukprot:6118650-Karenia_brevis.AAC.1
MEHRITEYLCDVEKGRGIEEKTVRKILNGKEVEVNGADMCYTVRGMLKWTNAGMPRYNQEERDIGTAYAESD